MPEHVISAMSRDAVDVVVDVGETTMYDSESAVHQSSSYYKVRVPGLACAPCANAQRTRQGARQDARSARTAHTELAWRIIGYAYERGCPFECARCDRLYAKHKLFSHVRTACESAAWFGGVSALGWFLDRGAAVNSSAYNYCAPNRDLSVARRLYARRIPLPDSLRGVRSLSGEHAMWFIEHGMPCDRVYEKCVHDDNYRALKYMHNNFRDFDPCAVLRQCVRMQFNSGIVEWVCDKFAPDKDDESVLEDAVDIADIGFVRLLIGYGFKVGGAAISKARKYAHTDRGRKILYALVAAHAVSTAN
jgi:hypothetical protein